MKRTKALHSVLLAAWLMSSLYGFAADPPAVVQVDWETRTASCPAKVTQSTAATIRVTNINDLLINFKRGETAQWQLRAKGTPVSVVPENLFFSPLQAALVGRKGVAKCDEATLIEHLKGVADAVDKNPNISPVEADGAYISWRKTRDVAHALDEVQVVEQDLASTTKECVDFFNAHPNNAVVTWIKRLDAQEGSNKSGAPLHSVDFTVNLEPNQNYEYVIEASWRDKVFKGGTLRWNCGEKDILSLSAGPIVTTLPYRTYVAQQVPSGSGTQNELVVNGGSVNVLGAALLNWHLPEIPRIPAWTGLAFSIGPVYTLGNAPGVSKLGLFAGGSIHLYRSVFFTSGVHIGEFADFPAGFHKGSVIPSGFGTLTPVTRNSVHFAVGITFKTTSFKKSSQSGGTASNTGASSVSGQSGTQPTSGNKPSSQPGQSGTGAAQPASGNQGSSQPGQSGTGTNPPATTQPQPGATQPSGSPPPPGSNQPPPGQTNPPPQ